MRYRDRSDGTIKAFSQIRALHADTLMTEGHDLTALGYGRIFPADPPVPDFGFTVALGEPVAFGEEEREQWVQVPLSPDVLIRQYERAVDAHLDAAAQARGYASIVTACTYAGDTHPRFGAEGDAFKAWRSQVYSACYAILADVTAGNRAQPTIAELLAELPALQLPA